MPRPLLSVLVCFACVAGASAPAFAQGERPAIGVAFGGGSARGLAHVGVIRWFEEHRIPIDMTAGTSMGGLIGGSFATGMDAAELDAMLQQLNWDEMFGASSFAFKNIRRKADARAYPSRLEFGLRRGILPPTSLNDGEQVDLLVARITAPYYAMRTFDELPTPFRAVAVDLLSATPVVLDRGSLASAMRATMSLPLVFPPVALDGQVLVDGGAMNNVPADVVRAMGARHVVAINVGDLSDRTTVNYSMLGVAGGALDAMMRANTKASIKQADTIINVPVGAYGSLDWRRSAELIAEGYKAAEAMRDTLLPLAVSDADYTKWKAGRQARRRISLPVPTFVRAEGFSASDDRRFTDLLERHVGVAFDVDRVQLDLAALGGLDRYESITWRIGNNAAGEIGLLVDARPKPYGPPFLMLGFNLENTTSQDFRVTLTGRYLRYDVLGSGSELRLDATIGSDPSLAAEIYKPLGKSRWFVAPYAGVANRTIDFIQDEAVVAAYKTTVSRIGANVGVNLGRVSDLRAGAYVGRFSGEVHIGDPGLPKVVGKETVSEITWRLNAQDSPVIPSVGSSAYASLQHVFDGPDITPPLPTARSSVGLTQLAGEMTTFWSLRKRNRLFVLAGAGTSFDNTPLPTDQFTLGSPLHLGAHAGGELRGDQYYILTGGFLRQMGRLPDFLGGSIFAGAWLENGDAFDDRDSASFRSNASAGLILDTIIGPVILAGSAGFDGRWRTYIGVGRIFGRRLP
jgi:NTE family protein